MSIEVKMDSMLPADVTDADPYFDLPSGCVDEMRKTLEVVPPKTAMVWCVRGSHWWEDAITDEKWWRHPKIKPCVAHSAINICSRCGYEDDPETAQDWQRDDNDFRICHKCAKFCSHCGLSGCAVCSAEGRE